MSETVSERVNKYKENYMIRDTKEEYFMEKYCELQKQYDDTPEEKVKTRQDLLDMMFKIDREVCLFTRPKNNIKVLFKFKNEESKKYFYKVFDELSKGLRKFNNSLPQFEDKRILLENGVAIDFYTEEKLNNTRGIQESDYDIVYNFNN